MSDATFLNWIRENCKVIYFGTLAPARDRPIPYPIEHTLAANKDQWATLRDKATKAAVGSGFK
jgi:hypothetical protein